MAGATTIDNTTWIADLSDAAYQSFCEGLSNMFGAEIRCDRRQATMAAAGQLQSHFKKLTAVHLVAADGVLHGTFHLLFDQAGLFILSGMVVMLPESRILEQVKRGSMDNTDSLQDAAKEVGNLLVGSWDTVFREQCRGHKHFVKKASFIGKLGAKDAQMELPANDQVVLVLYEMTVEPYPSFTCAAVFPNSVLAGIDGAGIAHVSEAPKQQEPVVMDVKPAHTGSQGDITDAPMSTTRGDDRIASPGAAPSPGPTDAAHPPEDSTSGAIPAAAVQAATASQRDEPCPEPQPAGPLDNTPAAADASVRRASQELDSIITVFRQNAGPSGEVSQLLHTPAQQIMQRDIVWASPEDTVQVVLAKMQQGNTGYVLIGQNGTLEGLVSNSSILGAVSLYLRPVFAKWRRPEDDATLGVKVKWIMSRPVRTIRPDTTLGTMIESMRRYGGRCLPVVDEKGTVQGLVTTFDILLHLLQADGNISWKGKPPQAPALLL
jgi:CBS domain-containing protein